MNRIAGLVRSLDSQPPRDWARHTPAPMVTRATTPRVSRIHGGTPEEEGGRSGGAGGSGRCPRRAAGREPQPCEDRVSHFGTYRRRAEPALRPRAVWVATPGSAKHARRGWTRRVLPRKPVRFGVFLSITPASGRGIQRRAAFPAERANHDRPSKPEPDSRRSDVFGSSRLVRRTRKTSTRRARPETLFMSSDNSLPCRKRKTSA